jgi:G3E family GTPase
VRGDLIDAVVALAGRRGEFDRIVIETTGLADPKPIIETFAAVDAVAEHCRLDGVVALVDAVNGWRHLGEPIDLGREGDGRGEGASSFPAELFSKPPPEAVSQVAYADRIVLNKCDLVLNPAAAARASGSSTKREDGETKGEENGSKRSLLGAGEGALRELEARLRTINALAPLVRSSLGDSREEVDPRWVLGVGGYDLTRVVGDVEGAMLARERAEAAEAEAKKKKGASSDAAPCGNPAHGEPGHVCSHDHDHGHGHGHEHGHAEHSHEVRVGEGEGKKEREKGRGREVEAGKEKRGKKLTKTGLFSSSSTTLFFYRPAATAATTSTATERRKRQQRLPPRPPSRSRATTRPSRPSRSTSPGRWTSSWSTCGSGPCSTCGPRTSTA